MENETIHCCVVQKLISKFVCRTEGANGDCQFCSWDGQVRLIKRSLQADDLDPLLKNLFSQYLVDKFNSGHITNLRELLSLDWQELVNSFGNKTAAKIKNILINKGITRLPHSWL